jgi:hypothetical protein
MGAYNTVSTTARCPRCDERVEVTVQFKYGDVWQHSYVWCFKRPLASSAPGTTGPAQ